MKKILVKFLLLNILINTCNVLASEYKESTCISNDYIVKNDEYNTCIKKYENKNLKWEKKLEINGLNFQTCNTNKNGDLIITFKRSIFDKYGNIQPNLHASFALFIIDTDKFIINKRGELISKHKGIDFFPYYPGDIYIIADFKLNNKHYMIGKEDTYTRTFFNMKKALYLLEIKNDKLITKTTLFAFYDKSNEKYKAMDVTVKNDTAIMEFKDWGTFYLKDDILTCDSLWHSIIHNYYKFTNLIPIFRSIKKEYQIIDVPQQRILIDKKSN